MRCKISLLNNNKKNKNKILKIKIFCFFKEFFNLKQFVDLNKFYLKKKINFKEFINKAMRNKNIMQKLIS